MFEETDESDFFPEVVRHHVVSSIEFVSSSSGTSREKIMMSPSEWATFLGKPDLTVVAVYLDHAGQLSMVFEGKP